MNEELLRLCEDRADGEKRMKDSCLMTDEEWARAFMGCKLPGVGYRFQESVEVLAKKLRAVREEERGKDARADLVIEKTPEEMQQLLDVFAATLDPGETGLTLDDHLARLREFCAGRQKLSTES